MVPKESGQRLALAERTRDVSRSKNIEDVRVGDLVLAKDEETGQLVPKRVSRLFPNVANHLRVLTLRTADGKRQVIKTTNEHPFYVKAHGWVEAQHLAAGAQLVQSNQQLATLVESRFEPHPEGVEVYNFEVEDAHNYYVASAETSRDGPAFAGILTHNECTHVDKLGNHFRKVGDSLVPSGTSGKIKKLDGMLAETEVAEIQAISNKFGTTIDIGGKRAAGIGRHIDTDLPIGHTDDIHRSDIDFRIDSKHPQARELIADLRKVGNGAGRADLKYSTADQPTYPPFIRFTPD